MKFPQNKKLTIEERVEYKYKERSDGRFGESRVYLSLLAHLLTNCSAAVWQWQRLLSDQSCVQPSPGSWEDSSVSSVDLFPDK